MNYIQKYQNGNSVSSVANEYKFRDKAAARYQVTGSVKDYLASQSQFL